jgi:hypothetical protein
MFDKKMKLSFLLTGIAGAGVPPFASSGGAQSVRLILNQFDSPL